METAQPSVMVLFLFLGLVAVAIMIVVAAIKHVNKKHTQEMQSRQPEPEYKKYPPIIPTDLTERQKRINELKEKQSSQHESYPIKEPENDANDAYGGWFDYETSVPLTTNLNITYRDANGNTTNRNIMVKRIGEEGMNAFCYMRNGGRTFLYSRIIQAVDLMTGEVIDNLRNHLWGLYENTHAGKFDKAFENLFDQIMILLFLAKSDGRMMAAERKIIAEFIIKHSPELGLEPEIVSEEIKSYLQPHQKHFKGYLSKTAQANLDLKNDVIEFSERIVGTQKTVDPMEAATLDQIRKALSN